MANSQGFWSYVHVDDEADGERISRLARDVSAQFEMLTGETLVLFLDKDAIKWGEDWRDKIDLSLALVAFFIPILTPRYFMSAECRRELQFFARQSTRLGIKELVLPVLYVDVLSLRDDTVADDLIQLVRTFQWEDWRDLRFVDVSAEAYRRGVARLAARLVEANRQLEKSDVAATANQSESLNETLDDDSPGFLDQLATAEEAMPKLVETMADITREIEHIGQVALEAAADIERSNKQPKAFVARLVVMRKLARLISEPAERLWSFGNQFASQLHEVDQGIRVLIERAMVEGQQNPDAKVAACSFFDVVRSTSASVKKSLASIQGMIDAIGPVEKMSRDLRPVLRRVRQGLTAMVEAREISDEWVQLIERSGMLCE